MTLKDLALLCGLLKSDHERPKMAQTLPDFADWLIFAVPLSPNQSFKVKVKPGEGQVSATSRITPVSVPLQSFCPIVNQGVI